MQVLLLAAIISIKIVLALGCAVMPYSGSRHLTHSYVQVCHLIQYISKQDVCHQLQSQVSLSQSRCWINYYALTPS